MVNLIFLAFHLVAQFLMLYCMIESMSSQDNKPSASQVYFCLIMPLVKLLNFDYDNHFFWPCLLYIFWKPYYFFA
jgi:hypothetical protein